jgi:hypothetical protein
MSVPKGNRLFSVDEARQELARLKALAVRSARARQYGTPPSDRDDQTSRDGASQASVVN